MNLDKLEKKYKKKDKKELLKSIQEKKNSKYVKK